MVKSCTYDKILDMDEIEKTENEIPQFVVCCRCRLFAVKAHIHRLTQRCAKNYSSSKVYCSQNYPVTRNKGILYKPRVLIPTDRFKLVTIYMNNSNLDVMFVL